jgi:hypothetical protein
MKFRGITEIELARWFMEKCGRDWRWINSILNSCSWINLKLFLVTSRNEVSKLINLNSDRQKIKNLKFTHGCDFNQPPLLGLMNWKCFFNFNNLISFGLETGWQPRVIYKTSNSVLSCARFSLWDSPHQLNPTIHRSQSNRWLTRK